MEKETEIKNEHIIETQENIENSIIDLGVSMEEDEVVIEIVNEEVGNNG